MGNFFATVKADLIRDEGLELQAYKCPAGYTTIGVGRNLESKGISQAEAMVLLKNDIFDCLSDCYRVFKNFDGFPDQAQRVFINMRFNLGPTGFRDFKKMIAAAEKADWQGVISEMKDSKWFTQVGERSVRLAEMIEELC
jgi:lysozyme